MAPSRRSKNASGTKALEGSEKFPKNFRELVSRQLLKKYGDKISIRSTIIHPPTQEKTMKGGEEIIWFKGSVNFNVVDRKDKDFGRQKMTYVIQNHEVTLQEGQ
jgi:hypothetical protein